MEVVVLGVLRQFRGDSLILALRKLQITPNISYGMDSRSFFPGFADLLINTKPGKVLKSSLVSMPEISCSAGHLYIYRWAEALGIDWVLVLEDDVTLLKNPLSLLGCLKEIDSPALISLQQAQSPISENGFSKREILLESRNLKCNSLQRLLEPRLQTCSYLINLAAIKRLNKGNKKVGLAFRPDWPLAIFSGIKFYVTKEPYFLHPESREDSLVYHSRTFSSTPPKNSRWVVLRIFQIVLPFLGIVSLRLKLSGVPFTSAFYYTAILPLRRKWHQKRQKKKQ